MKNLSWAPLGALALAITALSPMVQAQTKSVAVTAIVEHPALDAIRDGVKAALKDAGYEEGKNLKWQYQSAQGNPGTAAQIARKFVGDKPDAIVAIATPSAQAVVAATKGVPVVAVRNSPKPPALRVSLTLETINSAQEIWIVAAGADKAAAVGLGLAGASELQVPASGARGIHKTLWLVDEAAAAKVPSALMRREH